MRWMKQNTKSISRSRQTPSKLNNHRWGMYIEKKSIYNLCEEQCVSNLLRQVMMTGTSSNLHLLWMSQVCRWEVMALLMWYISITSPASIMFSWYTGKEHILEVVMSDVGCFWGGSSTRFLKESISSHWPNVWWYEQWQKNLERRVRKWWVMGQSLAVCFLSSREVSMILTHCCSFCLSSTYLIWQAFYGSHGCQVTPFMLVTLNLIP